MEWILLAIKPLRQSKLFLGLLALTTSIRVAVALAVTVIAILIMIGAFVIISAVGEYLTGVTSLSELLNPTGSSVSVSDLESVSVGGTNYSFGAIDYSNLPDIASLDTESWMYPVGNLEMALMIRELAIEICSRPEINIKPEYLLGIMYNEITMDPHLQDSNSDIYHTISTRGLGGDSNLGTAQTDTGKWNTFDTGYISKTENPNLTDEQRVFHSEDVSNTVYRTSQCVRPSPFYVSDSMYFTAYKISRISHGVSIDSGYGVSGRLGSNSKPAYEAILNSELEDSAKGRLFFLLSAHLYNGPRKSALFNTGIEYYIDAENSVGPLDQYYRFNMSRSSIDDFMTGISNGTFSDSPLPSPFHRTLVAQVDSKQGTAYASFFSNDYSTGAHAEDDYKNPLVFWRYGMHSLNAGKNIMETLNSYYNQLVVDSGVFAWPLPNTAKLISSKFSNRISPIDGLWEMHNGLDLPSPLGTPVYAVESGTVVTSRFSTSWGNLVEVSHAGSFKSLYAHLNGRGVEKGDVINKGDLLGWVGSTGKSTGNHLHFTLYNNYVAVDPMEYLTLPEGWYIHE